MLRDERRVGVPEFDSGTRFSQSYQIPALAGVTRTDYSSAAYGVNINGLAVGYTQNQTLANRALIYSAQTAITTDLNTYPLDGGQTPGGLGWTLTSAVSINDSGVMVGHGSNALGFTC